MNLVNIFLFNNFSSAKNKHNSCPEEIENLGNYLVKDIPSYTNRILQKSSNLSRKIAPFPVYVVNASKSELNAFPLPENEFKLQDEKDIKQIFFTTLERQYPHKDRVIETQNYHWLFLARYENKWLLIKSLSRFGSSNSQKISPIKDSTQGTMGQAVKLWLKDCNYDAQK